MAERKRQYVTYTDAEFGDTIEDTAEQHNMSVSELLREGARRQISALQAEENNE